MITTERLREVLSYDPHSGEFRWLVSSGRVKAGDIAGFDHPKGYRRISIDGRSYLAHRLVWLYVKGKWPRDQIDHTSGVRDDNRLCNLREATNAENGQNQRRAASSNKSCGLLGVSWNKSRGRWEAKIKTCKRQRFLGYFDTAEEAHAAYVQAKTHFHPFQTIAGAIE